MSAPKDPIKREEWKRKIGEANKGQPAWNKGLTKETDKRVYKYSKSLKGIRPHIRGKNNAFYGKKHSEETKRKISEAGKGRIFKHTKETKLKISKALTGIKRSIETKAKISESSKKNNTKYWKGKKRIDISKNMMSENNPGWKGGIQCEPYCDVWLDQDFKESIKQRDGYTCQHCCITEQLSLKVYSQSLGIHHINYNKKDCRPSNLITTCCSCNAKANFHRETWQLYYDVLLNGIPKEELTEKI